MSAERWERVKRLVDEALSRDSLERGRYLDETCAGDDTLRAEVESLLRYEGEGLSLPGAAPEGETVGRTLAHYEIVEALGQGGMGVVYRAHDPTLGRDVALKVLPSSTFKDPIARARLLREARSAARLNHPNICTIYEVGEAEGQAYIAMELIEGETLSARMVRRPLSPEEFLAHALQLSEALAHAQERGVVHRDLKGANVLVTGDGRIKVLDFGLAKRIPGAAADDATHTEMTLTQPGAVVGTLAYMAPEQLRGESADMRSDIWALGVILYEMVAGSRPFQGQSSYQLTNSILSESPRRLPSRVPLGLQGLIERCLEKEPGRRYQRAVEVRAALEALQSASGSTTGVRYVVTRRRWLLTGAGLALAVVVVAGLELAGVRWSLPGLGDADRISSLVVLPFTNLSGDESQDFFADGMTEALIAELSQISGLEVVSRTSAMQYRDTTKPLLEIVDELGVEGVIEGGVLREGDTVRVTIKLIGGSTDKTLWAQTFDREATGILALYSDVARAIAQEVQVTLSPQEEALLARASPVDPEAYEDYLKGRMHWYKQTPFDVDRALQYFRRALEKDPSLALAHVGMGYVWTYYASAGLMPTDEMKDKVIESIRAAVQIDPSLAEAHEGEANYRFYYDWDWQAAESSFQRGIELKPSSVDMRLYYWEFLAAMNRIDEAEEQLDRCLELDPFNSYVQMSYGLFLLSSRRFAEAVSQFEEILRTDMDFGPAHLGLWQAHHHRGEYERALASAKEYFTKWGDEEMAELLEASAAQSGYRAAMLAAAERRVERADRFVVLGLEVAQLFAYAGDTERALDWLEKAYEARETGLVKLQVDPDWDGLRGSPRFQSLLEKMEFPPS